MDTSIVAGFSHELSQVQERLSALQDQVSQSPIARSDLLTVCLEELETAVEELHIVHEELHHQNEELVLAREAAELNSLRYEDLFELAPVGYLVTDLYGIVLKINQRAGALLNGDSPRIVGKPLATFIPEDQRPEFRHVVNRLPHTLMVQDWEMTLRPIKQAAIEASLTVQVVESLEDSSPSLRWIVQDIGDRKRAERELEQVRRQNLELARADRLRQQFLSHVSHELRTPLNAILGFSELLNRRLGDSDPHSVKMLKSIASGGETLLEMVNELLDLSRLCAGRIRLEPRAFDLAQLASKVVEDLRPLADQKLLKLELTAPETLMVNNDAKRVRQIITNLVANGINYTQRGSVWVKLAVAGDRVVLKVQDTGIGIASEDQSHIFEEFWQVQQPEASKTGGTGLGLAIVKAIVEAMEGRITVESRQHRGTTFRVELPQKVASDSQQLR